MANVHLAQITFDRTYLALWWIPAGRIPSIDEAKKRLASIEQQGPTPFAFTFKDAFPPDEALIAATNLHWRRGPTPAATFR